MTDPFLPADSDGDPQVLLPPPFPGSLPPAPADPEPPVQVPPPEDDPALP